MITKNYKITNQKIDKDIKLAIFSDIHFSNTFNIKIFDKIIKNLKENKPDYILIPGDIVDKVNILDYKSDILLDFFKELGTISKTYITLGNHDYLRKEKKKYKKEYHYFWEQELKQLKKHNVFLLTNESNLTKNINFISYNPPYKYYYNNKNKKVKNYLSEELNNNSELFKETKKINILLFHDPFYITKEEIIKHLKNIDIIISGHMHNGMIPNILDNIYPKNRGIIAPNRKLYPDNARGIKTIKYQEKEIKLIISGGITKLSESSTKLLHILNFIYKSQIEYLTITKN